jgi:hypothetical protein
MGGMEVNEPDDLDREIERLRDQLDAAHAALIAAIRRGLGQGRRPARIARHARWTPEYIAHIRDGKAGNGLRRRQPDGARPVKHASPAS